MTRFLFGLLALFSWACDRSEPPTRAEPAPAKNTSAARARPPRPGTPATSIASASAAPEASVAAAAVADAGAASVDAGAPPNAGIASLAPKLVGDDAKPLPQTEDKPKLDSPWFQAGIKAVFQAMVTDDPSVAEPFFFPLEAYRQVKDVADPDRDWKRRLIANFRRDVHDYHQKLGPHASDAKFVGIDVPEERMRWMKPHTEGNKGAYFRVTHSRLRYQTAEGTPKSLEVTSFISWRGEWYIVHLNGFK